jgi:hypothetical protein
MTTQAKPRGLGERPVSHPDRHSFSAAVIIAAKSGSAAVIMVR